MSELTTIEKDKLEKLLKMENGYVLDLNNRRFQELIQEHTNINIDEDKYSTNGSSKAKRLRTFWNVETNLTVAKLISGFVEYWKHKKIDRKEQITPTEKTLVEECEKIALRLVDKGSTDTEQDETSTDVHFEAIQGNIIKHIKNAKFIIWIAVAWFTDQTLFNQLIDMKRKGVNIQIIICDDCINTGIPFEKWFETYRIKQSGRFDNLMHNKFCIIDLKTVLHGSYNWTKRAQYNNETMTVVKGRQNAEKFAEQFIKLKKNIASPTHILK